MPRALGIRGTRTAHGSSTARRYQPRCIRAAFHVATEAHRVANKSWLPSRRRGQGSPGRKCCASTGSHNGLPHRRSSPRCRHHGDADARPPRAGSRWSASSSLGFHRSHHAVRVHRPRHGDAYTAALQCVQQNEPRCRASRRFLRRPHALTMAVGSRITPVSLSVQGRTLAGMRFHPWRHLAGTHPDLSRRSRRAIACYAWAQ